MGPADETMDDLWNLSSQQLEEIFSALDQYTDDFSVGVS
jgi:hypothetical protein